MAFDRGRCRGCAIRWLIADQKARFPIHGPAPQEIQYHPRRRLAPVADAAIFGTNSLRVERAIADIVEMSSSCCELDRKLRMEIPHIFLRIKPPRDPGLIGDEENE